MFSNSLMFKAVNKDLKTHFFLKKIQHYSLDSCFDNSDRWMDY